MWFLSRNNDKFTVYINHTRMGVVYKMDGKWTGKDGILYPTLREAGQSFI
jgi:hypothetical protein